MTRKKDGNSVEILGINLSSAPEGEVLKKIVKRVEEKKKTFVVTPNPEFFVFTQDNPWFKKILNSATIAVPDGVGLVWASWVLGTEPRLKQRITGADLSAGLLIEANKKHWRVGVVGVRRGVEKEARVFIQNLQKKYRQAKIFNLEEINEWQKKEWEIIFACQGMGKQEKWIQAHFKTAKAGLFMGAGGALDYLTGFVPRAPAWFRRIGLEWLYRLFKQPWRWRRQLALIYFIWLIGKAKLKN
ncbi:MAG TPA: WecB/TagA/CpsF family glycosyltransferase [Nevskiaceae bacterium]|nr:WecB/TagA/CpsF family glycosyltransferase [Nevskiaceae bacterium]